jgi:hypothetical protein
MDEHGVGESPTTGYRVPVISEHNGMVSCRYNRGWTRPAAERLNAPLTEDEEGLRDFFDNIARESCLELPFYAGDIQFVNNYTVLHGRAAHQLVPDEDQKRVLIRIWVDFLDYQRFGNEALMCYGVVRHGQLGWSVQQLLAGANREPHARQPNGLPVA